MKCNHTGCPDEATHVILLILRERENGPMAVSTPIVYVCAAHGMDVTWDDLMTAQGWAQIVRAMKAKGYVPPRKKYSTLEVLPLVDYRKGMQ